MSAHQTKNPNRREFVKTVAQTCAGTCLLLAASSFSSCTKSVKTKSMLPANNDFSMVSYCCLKCNECEAYLATQKNDQRLREEVAKKWNMKAEQINCNGCKTPSALFNCSAKQCAVTKNVLTCAHCTDFPTCTNETWSKWPDLKKNVEEMRKELQA